MKQFFNTCISYILILTLSVWAVLAVSAQVLAADDSPFQIIPKADDTSFWEKVKDLQNSKKTPNFWKWFNEQGDKYDWDKDLGAALSSWIVTWDTILIMASRVVKIISQMWLVVWSAMFIYAWYLYGISVFSWDETSKANDAMKNAVIGLVIIIFSYAINRIVLFAFVT